MSRRGTQIYTWIVDALKARVANGEWVAGQRLPSITQLAHEFKVGTGSIREAVKALESLGIIRIEHGRGMFVADQFEPPPDLRAYFQDVGPGSILALCEARCILEPEIAALAAERATENEMQAIHTQALQMEQLVNAGENFLVPDLEFHRQVALAAHNPVLARMMDGVNDLLQESRKYTADNHDMKFRAVKYHLLISDTIRERNSVQARLLMLAHVNDAINVILATQQFPTPG